MIPMVDAAIIDSFVRLRLIRFDSIHSPVAGLSVNRYAAACNQPRHFFLALAEHGHHLNRRQVKLQYNTGKSRF